ncbi:hypothetical protein OPV22_011147 [Ensete ventricosum]|uniref:RWP-RK domain-containing protein n=1 Tax=Ensete ventricosum TaxID=4639 RepID=A0AAV8RF10_ENSVE|nr:hypothetical protein OPV22_011147 [Ensete ventricosum]
MDKPDRSDSEDDILRYLNFSDQEPLPLPPPPPPPPLAMDHDPERLDQTPEPAYDDAPVWGLNYESILQGVQDFDTGEGSSRNTEVVDPVFVQFQPGQLDCTNCCVLRELVHSNGFQNVKVVVHGGPGFFTHAIFEIEHQGEMGQQGTVDFYYINLSTQTGAWVEGFLKMYIMLLDADGSVIMQDTATAYYNTLCDGVKTELPDYSIMESWLQTTEQAPGTVLTENTSLSIEAEAPVVASTRAKIKTGLAAQRERAHNMSLKELADYFHLPIADAAKRLKLCSTAIKHACRRNGVARWPSRKIKSIDRQIAILERQLLGSSHEVILEKINEIEKLKAKKERLYAGLES